MKTYSYTKPELNLTIVITPKAWAWAERRYSTPAVYADHQAAQFLAGRPVDNDVVIEWITKPCETEADRGGVAVAQAQPPVTVQPVINAAPVVESAAGEWPKWMRDDHLGGRLIRLDKEHCGKEWHKSPQWPDADVDDYAHSSSSVWRGSQITPAEASKWLRANGHASVADELDAAEKYEPVGTLPDIGDRAVALRDDHPDHILPHDCLAVQIGVPTGLFIGDGEDDNGVPEFDFYDAADPTWAISLEVASFVNGSSRILKRKGKTNG